MKMSVGITVASDGDTFVGEHKNNYPHYRLFCSCLSIYVFLIASLLCFPRPVYVLLRELLSVNKLLVL